MHTAESEAAKYAAMWKIPDYRRHSPGEVIAGNARVFFHPVGPVNDYGMGTGRAAQLLQNAGFDVQGYDIAPNCRDAGVSVPLEVCCLWDFTPRESDWALCTDVMEHIPTEHVDAVLANIAKATRKGALFQIATTPDRMGKLIGQPLHLTVQGPEWWREKLQEHFAQVEIQGRVIARCRV